MDWARVTHSAPDSTVRETASCRFCRHGNPPGAKFCNECGSPLELQPCWACDAVNAVDAERCHACGAVLSTAVPPDFDKAEVQLQALVSEYDGDAAAAEVDQEGGDPPRTEVAAPEAAEPEAAELARFSAAAPAPEPEADEPASFSAAAPAPEPEAAELARFSALTPAPRGSRLLRGRRAARPVLAMFVLAIVAVPVVLTTWPVGRPAPRIAMPEGSHGSSAAAAPPASTSHVATARKETIAWPHPLVAVPAAAPMATSVFEPSARADEPRTALPSVPASAVSPAGSETSSAPVSSSASSSGAADRTRIPGASSSRERERVGSASAPARGAKSASARTASEKPRGAQAAGRGQSRSASTGSTGQGRTQCTPSSILAGCMPGA